MVSLSTSLKSLKRKIIYIFILAIIINIANSLCNHCDDMELAEQILKSKDIAKEKLNKYKEDYINNLKNITKEEKEQAIFFNKTGISQLEQEITNKQTSGIKYAFIDKYFKFFSRSNGFTDKVKKYFEPIFLKVSKQTNDWKSYELMYNNYESGNIYFVNFLVKNKFQQEKIDVIVNQVNLKYKISNFILIQETTKDKKGRISKNIKYISEEVEQKHINKKVEVIQDVITYTAYSSLAEFLQIEDLNKKPNEKLFNFENLKFLE